MCYTIETRNITKRFGQTLANDHINLTVQKGHIHAILGENGAGKSTLMKILYGEEQPDEGEVLINGAEQVLTPAIAMSLGIGLIHQHFMLINKYTIPENFALGQEPRKWGFFSDYRQVKKDAVEVLEKLDLPLDINKPVGFFSVEEQQIIEIGKALYRGADILILDEPTSVLTPQKIEKLLDILRALRAEGKTILLITHKLQEALSVADEITILRKGKIIANLPRKEADQDKLVRMMMGTDVCSVVARENVRGSVYVQVKNLVVAGKTGKNIVDHVSFDIHRGEVYGITGVGGNGQSELVEALVGLKVPDSGELWVDGRQISKLDLSRRRLSGISYVPEDRVHRGSCRELSVMDNVVMGHHNRPPIRRGLRMDHQRSRKMTETLIQQYDVVVDSPDALAGSLSGGNMQKIVIAREFSFDASFMIIAYPSQGIDFRTTSFVHSEIIRRRNQGTAILLITGDMEEVFTLTDRIGVMFGGNIVFESSPENTDRFELGQYMTGLRRNQR